ncbi:DNA-3-methyladenine glycosylase [Bdellovibrio sp. HCB288]|uniref:DNA-3-methyladenine glycosylase n=1 Tax=Bdellovibrio sp. HCB288 TaxID=3394355 RepID=UPI0039B6E414
MKILPQDFYFEDTITVAKSLLGKTLHIKTTGSVHQARIVEVEAYLGIKDPACHTFEGRRTPRTSSMYLSGGHSYVYQIYGMYFCLNVVTRSEQHPEAVLIRALEPLPLAAKFEKSQLVSNGPGKLCRHYEINKDHNGLQMWRKQSALCISDSGFKVTTSQIIERPRIGVDYAGDAALWPLRFYLADNKFVSRK